MKKFSLLHIPTACRCELEYESELDLLVDLYSFLDINKNTIFINEEHLTFVLSCVVSSDSGVARLNNKILNGYTTIQVNRHEFMIDEELVGED